MSEVVELRQHLLADLDRWNEELQTGGVRGTLGIGMAMNATSACEALVRACLNELAPERIPARATFGELVQLLRVVGREERMRCSQQQRALIIPTEHPVLTRVTRIRNAVAHRDVIEVDALQAREAVEAVAELANLPLFVELSCRSERSSA